MKLNLNINNVNVTLEGNNNNEIMNVLNMLMSSDYRPEPAVETNIRNDFRETVSAVLPKQNSYRTPVPARNTFIPCSDKQKSLLKKIPEFKNVDLDMVSKSEASMAIEKWNKSRSYHYKDHY